MSAIDPSAIDTTQPPALNPTTSGMRAVIAAIRAQFVTAKAEIEALQEEVEVPTLDQAPIPGTAGENAAGALLDISAASGRRCVISAEGPIRVRLGPTPVTQTTYHLFVPMGTSGVFIVPAAVVELSAWGDGGAWRFCLTPLS